MAEKNTKNANAKVNKPAKQFYNRHMGEFRKIIWPERTELMKQTVTTIALSLIVGAIIWGYDEIFEYLYHALITLVK